MFQVLNYECFMIFVDIFNIQISPLINRSQFIEMQKVYFNYMVCIGRECF